jgi:hypothetical protein
MAAACPDCRDYLALVAGLGELDRLNYLAARQASSLARALQEVIEAPSGPARDRAARAAEAEGVLCLARLDAVRAARREVHARLDVAAAP